MNIDNDIYMYYTFIVEILSLAVTILTIHTNIVPIICTLITSQTISIITFRSSIHYMLVRIVTILIIIIIGVITVV